MKQAFITGMIGMLLLIQPLSSQTWEPTKRLTWNSGETGFIAIAADSNNHIHVVWDDSTPGNFEIFYKKSTNGGTTWTTKRLTYSPGNSFLCRGFLLPDSSRSPPHGPLPGSRKEIPTVCGHRHRRLGGWGHRRLSHRGRGLAGPWGFLLRVRAGGDAGRVCRRPGVL